MSRLVTLAKIQVCIGAGRTQSETARHLGLSAVTISQYKSRFWLLFHSNGRGVGRKTSDPRSVAMAALYRDGSTLKQIGTHYGITRERVRQILKKYHGFTAQDGGCRIRSQQRSVQKRSARAAKWLAKYGIDYQRWSEIRDFGRTMVANGAPVCRTPLRAFNQQRSNAHHRDIGWELSLWTWWLIWQQSGKWENRGRGQGYVMCRFGDVGPYAAHNVFIALAAENNSKNKNKKNLLPRGVIPAGKSFKAKRQINGVTHYLGTYPTPDMAYAAYLTARAA